MTKTEYPESKEGDTVGPTIFGHTGATGAVSTAAIRYSTETQPERYSSRGPVTHYFGPVNGTAPAAPLGSAEVIAKPDITATDCGATTFFAFFVESEATWRFCGTSAAAPHAAGVAALELDAKPSATPAEVRGAQENTASPIGPFEPKAVGAGLLKADAAVASLAPPSEVTITNGPLSRTADSTPTFEFQAAAPVECFIDGVPQMSGCSSPYTVASPLEDGPHTFEVKIEGGDDNAMFSFTVDTTPPTATIAKQPAFTADSTPTFFFTASEPAGFTCAIDRAAAKPCVSPYTMISPLSDGSHTFEVSATDQVGNTGHASVDFSVDTTPPIIEISSQPLDDTREKTPTFGFTANEPSNFKCAIDGAPFEFCESPYTTPTPLVDGPHSFEVVGTDQAGNAGRASASFTVDTRPPNTFFRKHPRHHIRIRNSKVRATFRFGSNESDVTFVCKVDRGLLRFCGAKLSRRFHVGKHVVRVKARDAAGNVDRTPAVFHFRVKQIG